MNVFFRVVLSNDADVDAAVAALRAFPCTRAMTTRAPTREVQGVAEVPSAAVLEDALRAQVPRLALLDMQEARPSPVVDAVERAVQAAASDGLVERLDLDPGLRQQRGAEAALLEAIVKARVPGGVLVVTAGLSADPKRSELSVVVADDPRARREANAFLQAVQQHVDDDDELGLGDHINAEGSFLLLEDPILRAAGLKGWRLMALAEDELALARAWDGAQLGAEIARLHPTLSSAPRASILADAALAERLNRCALAEGSSSGRLTLRQLLVLDVPGGGIEVRLSRKDALALAAALRTTRVQSAPFVVEGPNAAIAFRPRSPAGCHRADESRLLLVDVPPHELKSLADWLVAPLGVGPVPGLSVYAR